jgi:Tol biopolymer transport system component
VGWVRRPGASGKIADGMRRAALILTLLAAAGCGRTDRVEEVAVVPVFALLTATLPAGAVGEAYDARVVALAEPAPDTANWSLAGGALPPGLSILPEGPLSARVVGVPVSPGRYTFRLQLRDPLGRTATGDYAVEVVDPAPPLEILTQTLPAGQVAGTYAVALDARGGQGPYVWRVGSGALPRGLAVARADDGRWQVAGVPAEGGRFSVTLVVADQVGRTASRTYGLEVMGAGEPLRVVTLELPEGRRGQLYAAEIAAAGGAEGYSWRIAQGSLPSGLTLGLSGTPATRLTGTPEEAGTFPLLVAVTDAAGSYAERRLTLVVSTDQAQLRIVTNTLPDGRVGRVYQAPITAEGGVAPYRWSVISGRPPTGLSLAADGTPSTTVSGTPQTSGTLAFQVQVVDQTGQAVSRPFSIAVREAIPALELVTQAVPNAVQGRLYQATVDAAGGVPPYTWAISQGSLPSGLTLDPAGTPSTGISGVPTVQGNFTFELTVRDSDGGVARRSLRIQVESPPTPPQIVTTQVPDGGLCVAYEAELATTGGFGTSFSWRISAGSLPPGLTLRPTGSPGQLFGHPTATGSFSFEVEATDGVGQVARRSYLSTVTSTGWPARWAVLVGPLTGGQRDVFLSDLCGDLPVAAVRASAGSGRLLGHEVALSADNRKLAFIGDYVRSGVDELFLVDLSSGGPAAPVRVHPAGDLGRSVSRFAFSPDGRWVAFASTIFGAGRSVVTVVDLQDPAAPGAPVQLNASAIAGATVAELSWSPTSDLLAIRGSFDAPGRTDLYVASPASSGSATRLTTGGAATANVVEVAWSPTGQGLAYRVDDQVDEQYELYWRPNGGAAQRLNTPRAGGDVLAFDFAPDGGSLTYEATQRTPFRELFWRSLTSSAPAQLVHPPLAAGREVADTLWSPTSGRLLYVADQSFFNRNELFVVAVGSAGPGVPVQVNLPLAASQEVRFGPTNLAWSPDGRWAAYLVNDNGPSPVEAYLADLGGATPVVTAVGPPRSDPSLDARALLFSPDGGRLAVAGDLLTPGTTELFVSELALPGLGPTRISAPLVMDGDVSSVDGAVAFRGDGTGLLYLADQATDLVQEAWSVSLLGGVGTSRRMHAVLSGNRRVERILVQR